MTPEMMTARIAQVSELVQTYRDHYAQFQRAAYNETQLRVDFVNRFFKLLGWDVDNEQGFAGSHPRSHRPRRRRRYSPQQKTGLLL